MRLKVFWRNRKVDSLEERRGKEKHFTKQNHESVIKSKDAESSPESAKVYWKKSKAVKKAMQKKGGQERTTKAAQKVDLFLAKTNLEQ